MRRRLSLPAASAVAVATVVGGVSALRLDLAVTIADGTDTYLLKRSACRLNIAFGVAATLVDIVWRLWSHHSADLGVALALGAVTATLGVSTTQVYICVRDRQYRMIAWSKLAQAAVQAGAQIGVGLVAPTATALLLASAAGYAASIMMLRRASAVQPSRARTREVLLRHRSFVLASAPASLINSLSLNLPLFVAAGTAGSVATANLALALRVGALPSALLGQALMPLLFGEIAYRLRSDPRTAARSYDKSLAGLAAVGFVSLSVLSIGVYYLAPLILGTSWSGVGLFLLLLLPYMIGQFAVNPLSQTLNAAGWNRSQFVWDASRFLAIIAAFIPVLRGWVGLHTGVLLFSLAMLVAYAAHVLLARAALKKAKASPKPIADQPSPDRSPEHVPA